MHISIISQASNCLFDGWKQFQTKGFDVALNFEEFSAEQKTPKVVRSGGKKEID